jgi:hypothetical protein
MRRKSYKKKSAPRRRRKMSGIGAVGSTAMSVAYTIAGGVAAQLVTKYVPLGNEKVKAAIPVALGLFLPRFVKGAAGQGLANGMVAVGGIKLIQSFGVLNGIGAVSPNSDFQTPMIAAAYNREGLVDTSYMTPSIAGLDEEGC